MTLRKYSWVVAAFLCLRAQPPVGSFNQLVLAIHSISLRSSYYTFRYPFSNTAMNPLPRDVYCVQTDEAEA